MNLTETLSENFIENSRFFHRQDAENTIVWCMGLVKLIGFCQFLFYSVENAAPGM